MIYMREKPCPRCGKTQEIALAVLHSIDVTGLEQEFRCHDCLNKFKFKVIIDAQVLPVEPRTAAGSLD